MTTQEMFEQFTDPKAVLKMQRKAAMATYQSWLSAHDEARKLSEDTLQRLLGDHEASLRPVREATEEMTKAQFDLGRRALEVGKTETERWFKTVLPTK
jgi:hypothetical protein